MMIRKPRMHHCFWCGEELGIYADHEPLDCCGKAECNREASRAEAIERAEAHAQLDRDRGWS